MRISLDADQTALAGALETMLGRHAGADRAQHVDGDDGFDAELFSALETGGYPEVALDDELGTLGAAMVATATTRALGRIPISNSALIAAPLEQDPAQPTAVGIDGARPLPWGRVATQAIFIGDTSVEVARLDPARATPCPSPYCATLAIPHVVESATLGGPAEIVRARAARDVGVAAEIAGLLRYALDLTVGYVKNRAQFGRPIGSFQAVQHRLADALVLVEGVELLTCEAAWNFGSVEAAAVAATAAADAAALLATELHQLTGAIGFTVEYPLALATLPLMALRVALGNTNAAAANVARARYEGVGP